MFEAYSRLFHRVLSDNWHTINDLILDGALKPPVFLVNESKTQLGFWRKSDRTLCVSSQMFLYHSEIEMVEVLKHEMAHQYADEVLGLQTGDEKPHGSAFKHACMRLGINSAASMIPHTKPHPIMDRIRKLLALAQSENEHEAAQAMRRAHQLMNRYELELDDHQEGAIYYKYLGTSHKQKSSTMQFVSTLLVRHFHIMVIWIPSRLVTNDKKRWMIEASGTKENLEIAEYVHDFLLREIEILWEKHRRKHRVKGKSNKMDYQTGILKGFMDKLDEEVAENEAPQTRELIHIKQERVKEFLYERHPNRKSGRRMTYRNNEIFKAGHAQGQQLNVRKGLYQGKKAKPVNRGLKLE